MRLAHKHMPGTMDFLGAQYAFPDRSGLTDQRVGGGITTPMVSPSSTSRNGRGIKRRHLWVELCVSFTNSTRFRTYIEHLERSGVIGTTLVASVNALQLRSETGSTL